MTAWHIITGEFPPQAGGVSDYTASLARGLAASGDPVTVHVPMDAGDIRPETGIAVHRLPDRFGPRGLRALDRAIAGAPLPRRILVQYVPQSFGWNAMNLPFCWWLQSRRHDPVWLMFHEVATPLESGQRLSHRALALVTRRMASTAARAAERIFVSIPAWEPLVRSLGATAPITWLPVPSAIAVADDAAGVERVRGAVAPGGEPVVGHFGTYGSLTRPLVEAAVRVVIERTASRILLLGRDSERVAADLATRMPGGQARIAGTGALDARRVSLALSACDVMLQPYPDGISSRRTSAMAGLSHGRATVTTDGALTESIWRDSGAVVLAPATDMQALGAAAALLAADPARVRHLGRAARALYEARFALGHTLDALREPLERVALGAAS